MTDFIRTPADNWANWKRNWSYLKNEV